MRAADYGHVIALELLAEADADLTGISSPFSCCTRQLEQAISLYGNLMDFQVHT